MFIIHTHVKKSKKTKPTAKQRQLKSEWESILKKYEPKKKTNSTKTKQALSFTNPVPYRRESRHIESLETNSLGDCTKRASQQYTGTAIIGIATMHKSNAVPVFNQKDAEEISRMRRG